jgi:hypothetical protein
MPVHPPNFPAALRTLAVASDTRPALGWALFFLLSDEPSAAQLQQFVEKERPDLARSFGVLVLARNEQHFEWATNDGSGAGIWVPYKVSHALAVLGACYRYVVPIDNELEWLRPGDLLSALREREASARVFAGYAPRYRPVNIISTWFFKEKELAALRGVLRDFNLFSWWSDLPLVLGRDMAAFLAYSGYPAHRNSATMFEFSPAYKYELWKVARGEWQLVDLEQEIGYQHCGSFETVSRPHYYDALRSLYPPGPRWINQGFCDLYAASCVNNSALVLRFHTDRGAWALELAENTDCMNPVLKEHELNVELALLRERNPQST